MLEFTKAYIYKIYCKDINIKDSYIGSTNNFKRRYYTHKNNSTNIKTKKYNYKVYKFIRDNGGWNNFNIDILFIVNVSSKLELQKIERRSIQFLKPTLNVQIPLRTRAEYYIDNSSKIKDTMNQYRINNHDKLYKQHQCICGGKYTYDSRHQHFKTKKHIEFMILHSDNLEHILKVAKCA